MLDKLLSPPPRETHCSVCGEPLRVEGILEPVWVTDYPRMAHQRCIDWTQRPFPYRWRLAQLRKAMRAITDAGRWLADVERVWPREAAQSLEEWETRHARIREVLRELL